MNIIKALLVISLMSIAFFACDNEEELLPTEDFRYSDLFQPSDTANQIEKDLFNKYGVRIRLDFNKKKDVTVAYLADDPYNRYPIPKVEEEHRASAYTYAQTLLENVPEEYTKKFFPLDIFFVKQYGGGWWKEDMKMLGRSRLVICWPNQMRNALPEIKEPEYHYYQDSVLTSMVWGNLSSMIAARLDEPISEFAAAGNPYDGGETYSKIQSQYWEDGDKETMMASMALLEREGGYIKGSGSKSFKIDFGHWLSLLATESYENIKEKYLDNSPKRKAKYDIIIEYFNEMGWDIQATGNKYREMHDLHPYPAPEEEEED